MRPLHLTRLALLAILPLASSASPTSCTVAALQGAEYDGAKNTCNAGCADGSSCIDSACAATKTNYKMMLEVTPPSNAHYASDVTFPIDLGGGIGGAHELQLDGLAQVTMSVDATGAGVTKGVPLSMRLTRVGALPGMTHVTYDARSAAGALFPPGKGSVSIAVPPGDYDVYLAPLDSDTLALMPPLDLSLVAKPTLGHFTFVSGPQERVVVLGSLKAFDLTVTDENGIEPLTEPVDGYDVSVIDRATGRLVSTVDHTCTHPSTAHVLLSPGLEQHTYSVRFSPPSETCDAASNPPLRPSYDFDLDALDVDGSSRGTVGMPRVATLTSTSDGKSAPITVNVGGHVKQKATPVRATLVFRSRKLSIPTTWKTGNPFYQTTGTSIAEDGGIQTVQLPAGQYDVQIIPSLTDTTAIAYAITIVDRRDLTAINNPLELSVNTKTTVFGEPVSSENFVFKLGTVDFLVAGNGVVPTGAEFAPLGRTKSISLDAVVSGFSTQIDPGSYDLVVRLPESSGYPWIVRPSLTIATPSADAGTAAGCTKGVACIDQLQAVAPVVLTGHVLDPNGDPVARATVRASAKVYDGDADTTPALRVITVGETISEEDGSYTLVVPSDFALLKAH